MINSIIDNNRKISQSEIEYQGFVVEFTENLTIAA